MLKIETLNFLSKQQEILDLQIVKKHNLKLNKEILQKKIIAFWVELGEYANEEKSFKYWKQGAAGSRELQLEEYIDGLHFVISIGNQINVDFSKFNFNPLLCKNNVEAYFEIIKEISNFAVAMNQESYFKLLNSFLEIAHVQKMTEKDLLEFYKMKHEKNQKRQVDNY